MWIDLNSNCSGVKGHPSHSCTIQQTVETSLSTVARNSLSSDSCSIVLLFNTKHPFLFLFSRTPWLTIKSPCAVWLDLPLLSLTSLVKPCAFLWFSDTTRVEFEPNLDSSGLTHVFTALILPTSYHLWKFRQEMPGTSPQMVSIKQCRW